MRLLGSVAFVMAAGGLCAPASGAVMLEYQGAFKLPNAFDWGASGAAFYPPGDGGSGSLKLLGHPWYSNVGEVGIPTDLKKKADGYGVGDLAVAAILDAPINANPPYEPGWGSSLEYLPATDKLYLGRPTGGQGYCDPDGANPFGPADGFPDSRRIGLYALEIPAAWAAANLSHAGQVMGTGASWAQYGYGPDLYAYNPHSFTGGLHDSVTTLLEYNSADPMVNFDRDDEWLGAAWVEVGGEALLLIAGGKDVTNMGNDPDAPDDKHAWMLAYSPADLAAVAAGSMNPDQPQPAGQFDIQELMFSGTAVRSMAYDRGNNVLYAVESVSSNLAVHVWHVTPEPAAAAMLLLGALPVLRRRR